MGALRIVKIALAATIAVFAIAAAYMSFAIFERQDALREITRYNVVWAAGQALSELHRFGERAAMHGLGDARIDKDEVQLRFDILFNRLAVLRGADVAAFTASDTEQAAVVEQFAALLEELQPIVDAIDRPGNLQIVLERLAPLESRFTRFAAAAYQFDGRLMGSDQRELLRLHLIFSVLAGALVLCGLAFIGLLFFQNRLLRRAHHELGAMARDLRAAKDAAEAASEAKSRFLANMSHEMRTPLNAIIGFAEIIEQQALGPVGQPKYREYAADIREGGRHLFDIVSDILTMAQLDAGTIEVTCEPIDLLHSVEATLSLFLGAPLAKDRTVTILGEAPGWPVLRADERAVRQMLLNLLSNAVKFSPPDTTISIACRQDAAGDVWLTVSDRGIGMTSTQAAAASQPFYQADNRLARRYEGTGLGLSIVKGLIERHGGRLEISSWINEGSQVGVVFPARLVEAVPMAAVA